MPPIDTDQVDAAKAAEKRGKPKAILYFQRDMQETAMEIASALRAQSKLANLVFAGMFSGPEHVESCAAVVIQATAPRAAMIAQAYADLSPNVEQFFFDDEGNWVDGPEIKRSASFEMPDLTGGATPTEDDPEANQTPAATNETENPDPVATDATPDAGNAADTPDAATPDPEAVDAAESKTGGKRGRGKTKS